jgi:ABC-2 type transport system ATP-binding protein
LLAPRKAIAGVSPSPCVANPGGASKAYPRFRLGPLDLEVPTGYVVALVGPNGSGKSTLFRLLMNLAQPDAGELRLFGRRYPDDEPAIKRRIGYLPERSVGHDELDARELGAFVARWYPSWDGARYTALLRLFEIDARRRFGRLSQGQQRKLAFALALATEPALLLLDEPTAGVDPFARRAMERELAAFMERGDRTALFATHVIEEVRRLADYVAFLGRGRLLGFYEKDALLESWRVLWVERAPDDAAALPGLVGVAAGPPARLVTRAPAAPPRSPPARAGSCGGVGVVGTGVNHPTVGDRILRDACSLPAIDTYRTVKSD